MSTYCIYDRRGWDLVSQCPMVKVISPYSSTTGTDNKTYISISAANTDAATLNTTFSTECFISGNPSTPPPPPPGT